MRRKKTLARKALVFDEKHLGSEPDFVDRTFENEEERNSAKLLAYNWYNYFTTSNENRDFVVRYCKDVLKYSRDKVRAIRYCGQYAISTSVERLIRMSGRGLELNEKENTYIKNVLDEIATKEKEEPEEKKVAPPKTIVSALIAELDDIEDKWICNEKVDEYNLYNRQQILNDSVAAINTMVRPWIEGRIEDYTLLKNKDPDMLEAFPGMTTREINSRLKFLQGLIADLDRLKSNKKAVRKPRVKKKPSAEKLVRNLKYLSESDEYKLKSIDPTRIVGSKRLYVFHTNGRILVEYVASGDDVLTMKGQTVQGFDEALSRQVKLRKPEDFLPSVLESTPKRIDTLWKSLTTKTSTPNGRLSAKSVLLRAALK